MRTSNRKEIEEFFREHKNFSECIIEKLALKDYGATLEVVFNYIWTESVELRPNLDERYEIVLRFRLVQELHINNALNSSMLRDPESINWGLNEVALVKVVDDNELQRDEPSPVPLTHLAFFWEGDRRIDVIFHKLEFPSMDALA
jgi:hypothetical protein